MQLKYRGVAYKARRAQSSVYPFTAEGRYRGCPIKFGAPQPRLGVCPPQQLVYRGVPYET